MAKTKLSEWSATASSNTDINSINIAEGMAPSDVNNAMREMMAQLKDFQTGADGDSLTVGGNLAVTGTSTFTGAATFNGAATFASVPSGVLPSGVVQMYAGLVASPPSGWLFCNGAAVNRTTYAALFAVIGTIYGSGDGSTTFNLPDLRDKFIIGASADSGGAAKSNVTGSYTQSGGSKDAVNVAHTHTGTTNTDGTHYHTVDWQGNPGGSGYPGFDGGGDARTSGNTTGTGVHNHAFTTDSSGVSGTNANLPPYFALAFLIKA